MNKVSGIRGQHYVINNRGFRIPIVRSDDEYFAQLMTNALIGEEKAYRYLRELSEHRTEYQSICDAVKEKYGYED